MANLPVDGPGVVQLPPTQPPKRRAPRPRWVNPVVGVLVMVLAAVAVSSILNNEVSKRLATVPPPSSVGTTTTTLAVQATTPVTVAEVMGARITRPNAPTTTSSTSTTVPEAPTAIEADTPSEIIEALEQLPVEEEHDGYRRSRFGFYKDEDNDQCGTREEVIVAEAMDLVMNTRNCNIQSGRWFSLFDGRPVQNKADLRVEHLVSLREAYESGAWAWEHSERNDYLNDLENPETLLAVTEESAEKRDGEDPSRWLPSNDTYLCDYLRGWVYIKTIYKMSVDAGERESIAGAALHC